MDRVTGETVATLKGHSGRIVAVAFSPDGRRIATASGDNRGGQVKVWDAATGHVLLSLTHDGHAFDLAFAPDGTRLRVTASGVAGPSKFVQRSWNATPLPAER